MGKKLKKHEKRKKKFIKSIDKLKNKINLKEKKLSKLNIKIASIEKKVAEKAPIDGIQIKDLNSKPKKKKRNTKLKFSYSIKLADFYYKSSAKMMISRIKNETNIKNSRIQQLSKTKFRVLIGPFNDIKSLKETYEKLSPMNFENFFSKLFTYFPNVKSVLFINFFHSSLAASFFNSSLVVITGGSLPHVEVTFPESINIYLKNWSLLFVFSINLFTFDLFELTNQ